MRGKKSIRAGKGQSLQAMTAIRRRRGVPPVLDRPNGFTVTEYADRFGLRYEVARCELEGLRRQGEVSKVYGRIRAADGKMRLGWLYFPARRANRKRR